jgi:hypothetical protein
VFLSLQISALGQVQEVNAAGIKELIGKIDSSLPRGRTFHVNYSVSNKYTDFYFNRSREMIQYISDSRAKGKTDIAAAGALSPDATAEGMINGFKRDLKHAPEANCLIDYSWSEQGFYMTQEYFWPNAGPGKLSKSGQTIYASDGKIMGTFYNDSQGTLQPATERPQANFENWAEVAYSVHLTSLSDLFSSMPDLNVAQDDVDFKIIGERHWPDKFVSHLELRVNRQTLRPGEFTEIEYDSSGHVFYKATKRWEFQNLSGFVLPKTTIEEVYDRGFDNQMYLSQVQTLTINSFSPVPVNAKESLAALLKTNRSIFDEITGSHYLSGNPEATLDHLSK